jgi:putative transcriptional regulator
MAPDAFLRRILACTALLAAAAIAGSAAAQDHSRTLLLVARPGLPDPNFRESVVLVTQDEKANAVGLIVNRPTQRSLASILPGERFKRFTEPVFFGGPVAANGLFALFSAPASPGDALVMLPGLFFAGNPSTLDELMHRPPSSIRFFTGYSGWGPEQLRGEIDRGDWYVLNADAETVFTKDTRDLWNRLVLKARTITAEVPLAGIPVDSSKH